LTAISEENILESSRRGVTPSAEEDIPSANVNSSININAVVAVVAVAAGTEEGTEILKVPLPAS
jgi:hypothetical protein